MKVPNTSGAEQSADLGRVFLRVRKSIAFESIRSGFRRPGGHLFHHSALCVSLNGGKVLMLFLLLLVNMISALCISETVGGHCQQYRSVYVSTPRITPAPIFQDAFRHHQNLPRRGESLAARPLEWGEWSSMESSRRAGRGSSLEGLE